MEKIIKNKGGRNKSDNPKSKRFTMRFTQLQWEKIERDFNKSKLYKSHSEMLVDRIINNKFNIKYTSFDLVELGKIRTDINKIGTNINQVSKVLNSNNNAFKKREFYSNLKLLSDKVSELTKVLDNYDS